MAALMRLGPFLASLVVAAAVLWFRDDGGPFSTPDRSNAGIVERLRSEYLRGSARTQGIRPLQGVWGAALETGHASGSEFVAVRADGGLTLLHGAGGALLGADIHTPIRNAARDFVQLSLPHRDAFEPAGSLSPPPAGQLRFYLMTIDGVLAYQTSEAVLRAGRHEFSPLLEAARELVERVDELLPEIARARTHRIFELAPE